MSLKESRDELLEKLLAFLWRQWSALGVPGYEQTKENWALDPEPLLVFTFNIARYEPRLFDEALAWLLANGRWIDTARLRGILKKQPSDSLQVIGGVLQYAASHGDKRKWQSLADLCRRLGGAGKGGEALFREKSGKAHPLALKKKADPDFLGFGLNRSCIRHQKPGREVLVNAGSNIRFLLRPLLGTGAKSECVLYLLTHESGRPKQIADAVGLFWLTVHQALQDLTKSGFVMTVKRGKRPVYHLSPTRWLYFLTGGSLDNYRPVGWLNWASIYGAISNHWRTMDELAFSDESDYMQRSRLQDSLDVLAREFMGSGIDIPHAPEAGSSAEMQQELAIKFLEKLFAA